MNTAEAVTLLQRLESTNQILIALSPEDYKGTGLTIHKRLVDENKETIFFYVNRLEFIDLIVKEHRLFRRGFHNVHRNL